MTPGVPQTDVGGRKSPECPEWNGASRAMRGRKSSQTGPMGWGQVRSRFLGGREKAEGQGLDTGP
jgi:hypothetical protein